MKSNLILFLQLLLSSTAQVAEHGTLLFEDNFDYFDATKWERRVTANRQGTNMEFQYYSSNGENSYTKNGILYIRPTLTADRYGEDFLYKGNLNLFQEGCLLFDGGCNRTAQTANHPDIINPVASAMLLSRKSFNFTYGTVEVRAKLPRGDWLWPAIWLSASGSPYGDGKWPAVGEIDMMESRGNNNFTCSGAPKGNNVVQSGFIWGVNSSKPFTTRSVGEKVLLGTDFAADFHIYTLQWNNTSASISVDGQVVTSIKPGAGGMWALGGFSSSIGPTDTVWKPLGGSILAPFDKPFHLKLNLAVGGIMFNPDTGTGACINSPYAKPWLSSSTTQMKSFWESRNLWLPTWNRCSEQHTLQVDYVRIYGLN